MRRKENFLSYRLHKLGTPKVLRTDGRTEDGRTAGRTDGVDPLLDLLSLKRRRKGITFSLYHGLQSLPPSPKRAERKERRRPFREAGSGHKQWNTVSCVDTFSIISKFSAQNSKI